MPDQTPIAVAAGKFWHSTRFFLWTMLAIFVISTTISVYVFAQIATERQQRVQVVTSLSCALAKDAQASLDAYAIRNIPGDSILVHAKTNILDAALALAPECDYQNTSPPKNQENP